MQYELCTSLEKSPQKNPIIGRIESKAGHGAGRPTQKMVQVFFVNFCLGSCLLYFLTLIKIPFFFGRLMKLQIDMALWRRL